MQLLTVSHNKTFENENRTSYFAVVDLNGGSSVVPRSAFYKKVKFGDLNADGKLDIMVPPTDSYQNIQYTEVPVWAPHNCPFCGESEPITDLYSSNCSRCDVNLKNYYEQYFYSPSCRECGSQLQTCYNDPYNPEQSLCCPTHGSVVFVEIDMGYVDNGEY